MLFSTVILILGLSVRWSLAAKPPAFIRPCSRNDPKLNECALRSGRIMMADNVILTGNKKFNVPVLDPLYIVSLNLDLSGFTVENTDMRITGLKNTVVTAVRIDPKTQRQEFGFTLPKIEITSNYNISGQILVLPIRGQGKSTMTLLNMNATMSNDYDLVKKKNGKTYMKIKNSKFVGGIPSLMTVKMENLFNGNKALGDNMNMFMNENWLELCKEFGPSFDVAFTQVAHQIYTGITSIIPYDELLPEKV